MKATNLNTGLELKGDDLGQVAYDIACQLAIILSRKEHPQE